jgi:hypothetical protein
VVVLLAVFRGFAGFVVVGVVALGVDGEAGMVVAAELVAAECGSACARW